MTDLPIERVTDTLATAAGALYEVPVGFTFPGLYAAMATAYMAEHGANTDVFLKVGYKNHENGALNAKAQFGQRIASIMEARKASAIKKGLPVPTWANEMEFLRDDRANPMIAWPVRLYDCSPVSEGAASVPQVKPADIKAVEVHDCFTVAEILASEDLGFFKPGKGWKAVEEGKTARSGSRPINTSGGLKSEGHPVGASGVGQVIEIWKQLRGEAGERQLPGNPDLGLTHNVSGTGQTCTDHIFERR
jgi:acetyl-CoA C-acetyltransferase